MWCNFIYIQYDILLDMSACINKHMKYKLEKKHRMEILR